MVDFDDDRCGPRKGVTIRAGVNRQKRCFPQLFISVEFIFQRRGFKELRSIPSFRSLKRSLTFIFFKKGQPQSSNTNLISHPRDE